MNNQKGQILLVVFMLLLFSSIILGGVVMLWQSSLNSSGLQKETLRAFYLAQSGIERARAEVAYWGEHSADHDDFANRIASASPLDGGFAGGTYSADITPPADHGGPKSKKITLNSIGRMGNSERRISWGLLISTDGPPFGKAYGFWRNAAADCVWEEQ